MTQHFLLSAKARICADESTAYDGLHAKFDTRRVNHSVEYRSDAGTTNNLAESAMPTHTQ